jgi:D-alanyl-D-alanine carboxypeptidase
MPNTLKTLWNGDFPLSQAFWHYAIAYGTIANILAQAAAIAACPSLSLSVSTTADDLATWMRALVGGKGLQCRLPAPVARQPRSARAGQARHAEIWLWHPDDHPRPNVIYYHEGEMPGYQSFMGYDLANDVTLIIWTNLTLALDGKATANTLMVKILDEIYTVSPLQEAK